jgi:hypothetical protein
MAYTQTARPTHTRRRLTCPCRLHTRTLVSMHRRTGASPWHCDVGQDLVLGEAQLDSRCALLQLRDWNAWRTDVLRLPASMGWSIYDCMPCMPQGL